MDAGVPPDATVRPMPMAVKVVEGVSVWSGTDVILHDILERQDSKTVLIPNALCTSVIVDRDRAVGVEYVDLNADETRRIFARFVVLAADAFRTPQILYASNIRPAALGRYLNDHLMVTARVELAEPIAQAISDPTVDSHPGVGGCWVPFADDLRPYHAQILFEAGTNHTTSRTRPHVANVAAFGRKQLAEDDRVIFSASRRDANDMPQMSVEYRWTSADRRTIQLLKSAIEEIGSHLGQLLPQGPHVLPPGASLHYQGTTRMGWELLNSVCDPVGRVHGVGSLHVGGGGLIETATACNPALTIVALAHRAAEHVARELAA
jgi:choline dehydrogenase-like flavoprotein